MDLLEQVKIAKERLLNHGVVAFPTETVIGLGVVFDDFVAYQKLNNIKRRPEDKPYTMMVKSTVEIQKYAVINEVTQRVIDAMNTKPVVKEAVKKEANETKKVSKKKETK